MKKLLIISFLALVAYFGINQYIQFTEKKKARELVNLEDKRIQRINQDLIKKIIKETVADDSWTNKIAKLEEQNYRVMSIEVEKILKEKTPIVFFGIVEDVSKINERNYRIQVEHYILSPYLMNIHLDITCSIGETEQFLEKMKKDDFLKLVTVIVDVDSVTNKMIVVSSGPIDVKVASGKCIKLVNGALE